MVFGKKNITQQKDGASTLHPTMLIDGDIKVAGPIYINCRIQGSITGKRDSANLTIGPEGEIVGDVAGADIEVYGIIVGNIECRNIVIHAKAHVKGNIIYQAIEMEPDAKIEGEIHSRRSNTSSAGAGSNSSNK